jgi:hypothetical protein
MGHETRLFLLQILLFFACAPPSNKSEGGQGGSIATSGAGGVATDGAAGGSGGVGTGGGSVASGGRGGNDGGAGGIGGVATGKCGSSDVPIQANGRVDKTSTGCGIEGVWWWTKDGNGTTLDGVSANQPPYTAGGMCIKGKTIVDPSNAAWGAIIGLDLNSNLAAGWDAKSQGGVGFDVEITGNAGGAELRIEFESNSDRTTAPPFVPVKPGNNVALIARAIVPVAWDVPNKGEQADASNLGKLQLHVVGGAVATDFNVCISRVTPIVAVCDDYALVDSNGYQLNNNVWGKESVTDYSQCVFTTGAGAATQFGWLWRWPVSTPSYQVRSYPEVMAGKSPWNTINNGHGLPAPITSQVSFTFNLDLAVDAPSAYNFAPEVWLTTDPQPNAGNVTDEIMFWLKHENMTPAGTVVGAFSNGGVDYDVYIKENHDPGADAGTPNGWRYTAFLAHQTVTSGTLQLKPFVDVLVARGLITGVRYYTGVEVGTEVTNGTGSVVFSNFSVSVTP